MKISEVSISHVRIPLKRVIKHASHARTDTDNILVRCTLEDGTTGFGEGLPRDYVTGETIDSSMEILRNSQIPSQLEHCSDFFQAVQMAERLHLPTAPEDDRKCSANAARCALEIAVLDAYGKKFKEPISSVTKLLAGDLFNPLNSVRYSGAITSASGLKMKVASLLYSLYGFKQMKVKVGIAGYDDAKRILQIRKWLGKKIDIRVDANEAWSIDEAAQRIQELESAGITCMEQPVPHEQVYKLKKIRTQVRTPIMLDESLCSMIDAERAVEHEACDYFNIRLSKCGGFIPSLRLAQYARRHGMKYQLGCQVGETAILSSAGRHFACSVCDIHYLEGSYDKHLVKENLSKRDITFGWGGVAPAIAGHGLGIVMDEKALARVSIRQEILRG